MKLLALSKARIISSFRNKGTIMWSIFFPILMLFLMVSIFGAQSSNPQIRISFALISNSTGIWSSIVKNIFNSISSKNKTFALSKITSEKKAVEELKKGKLDLIIIIPKNFDESFMKKTLPILIKYNGNKGVSKVAKDIITSIIENINLQALKHFGKKINIPKGKIIYIEGKSSSNSFNIVDYYFVGIMIMAVLSIGSFNVPISLVWEKINGTTKRFKVTPLKSIEMFASVVNNFLFLALIQFVMLSSISIFIYKSNPSKIISLPVLYYTLFGALLSISMGFFISSISKSTGAANAIGNLIFFPFQFLGGLYFPVLNLPNILRWIVIGNPVTYIAAGMRDAMKITPNPFNTVQTILVPILWLLIFSIIGIIVYNFKGREV